MITIKCNHLSAALLCAATKDIKYYLNVVRFTVDADSSAALVGCDGYRLFQGRFTPLWTGDPQAGPFEILIPRETVKTALGVAKAARAKTVDLIALPDGGYSLGAITFTPVDGEYPDVARVIPTETSGLPDQYNWDYIVDARDALRHWTGIKQGNFALEYNGGAGAGVMRAQDALCCVMPRLLTRREAEQIVTYLGHAPAAQRPAPMRATAEVYNSRGVLI